MVHLKRFSYTSRLRDKLTAQVDFPLEGLDLSEHVLREQGVPPVYDLFAVSNHMGGLGGGHYTAYAKQPGTENWYCFDDSRVYPVKDVSQVCQMLESMNPLFCRVPAIFSLVPLTPFCGMQFAGGELKRLCVILSATK